MSTRIRRNLVLLFAAAGVLALAGAALARPALAGETAGAQAPETASAWSRTFDSPVIWQRVTPLGDLLVDTASALYGVNPGTGEIRWKEPRLGNLSERTFEMIPDSPFVVIGDGEEGGRVAVLDSMEGKLVFDSAAAGIDNVMSRHLLPGSHGLLVSGARDGAPLAGLSMFDVESGERKWTNDEIFKTKRTLFKMAAAFLDKSGESSKVANESYEVDENTFLFASDLGISKVDSRTGKVLWQITNFQGASPRLFFSRSRPDILVVGARYVNDMGAGSQSVEAVYGAYRVSDGAAIWKQPARLDGEVNDVVFHDKGLLLSPLTQGKARIKLIDYASGESLWGKRGRGIDASGGIVDHVSYGDEMLVTTAYDSAWTNKGAKYLLNVLDMGAGAFRFEKPLEVRGRILQAEMIPAGILFVTTSEAGILDSKTGQPISKETVESDDSVIAAEKDGKMYVFSTGQQALYLIDKAAGTIRKISDRPVKFEDDEIPFSLEIADGQITVVSNQNIAAFTPEGHVLYNEYHPAPRRSAFVRAMLIANSIRAGMASAASGMVGGAFASASANQEPGSAGSTLAAGMAQGYGEMAVGLGSLSKRYMDAARERFNASTNTSEYVFMMVQTEDSFGLAKVAKESGKIVAIMDMNKDKSPSYQVDTIANRMYYRSKPNEILGFQL